MIPEARISSLNDSPVREDGDFVLYWMQRSQRAKFNHALEYAVQRANALGLPVVCYFGITDNFPEANLRHYAFMLEGLEETARRLSERGITPQIRLESPAEGAVELSEKAALLVTDMGYLRVHREWRREVAAKSACRVIRVESDAVVPLEAATDKAEYAARTIRPRIHRHLDEYLVPMPEMKVENQGRVDIDGGISMEDFGKILEKLDVDRSVGPVSNFAGGYSAARARLDEFIESKLADYAEESNDPNAGVLSGLSPYLHFGQISPLEVALAVIESDLDGEDFLEQLIVRRELAFNFCHFREDYDSFPGFLPDWARKTLENHASDPREYIYSREEFERAKTHDRYWNAAQREMVRTGKMHGYMRMYWGKKILEWSTTPGDAYETAIYLNNKYELDGRDPNGYAGVGWCFGLHDQAWKERPVFGKTRYMNDNGLRRKLDADKYAERFSG